MRLGKLMENRFQNSNWIGSCDGYHVTKIRDYSRPFAVSSFFSYQLCFVAFLVVFTSTILPSNAEFFDPMVHDRQKLFEYLEEIEEQVGQEVYESVAMDRVMKLAGTMGPIDRDLVSAEQFIAHLQHLAAVEKRFYKGEPLPKETVEAFLMPLRIRYELTSRSDWQLRLSEKFQEVTKESETADDCAERILSWVASELVLTGEKGAYRLPMRGDLDPLTVLRGGRGSEIDLAIFGVAALRANGVAARIVWAPSLRGEIGGKVWVEYFSEDGSWVTWVPSYGAPADHRTRLRQELGGKVAMVMAAPDNPIEVTGEYVETVQIRIQAAQEETEVALMILGKEGLMPVRGSGTEYAKNEREAVVGSGMLILASKSPRLSSFALLPIEIPENTSEITIVAENGDLFILSPSNKEPEKNQ